MQEDRDFLAERVGWWRQRLLLCFQSVCLCFLFLFLTVFVVFTDKVLSVWSSGPHLQRRTFCTPYCDLATSESGSTLVCSMWRGKISLGGTRFGTTRRPLKTSGRRVILTAFPPKQPNDPRNCRVFKLLVFFVFSVFLCGLVGPNRNE